MPSPSAYSPDQVQAFYDQYAATEWDRLEADPAARVNFHIHRHYLRAVILPGDHVLDAGAGPGRFTIELARLGARVTVGDISPVQLALNQEKVMAAGVEDRVVARVPLDIVDLSRFPDGHFDAVLCYGGPLSYVFDQADRALAELLRVTHPGGHLLISVMSLIGTTRRFLPAILGLAREHGAALVDQVCRTGDLRSKIMSPNRHFCHMYRWSELREILGRHPCTLVAASAANCLALRNEQALAELANDPAQWEQFLAWEVDFSREPGALDGGTHIIAVLRRS